MNKFLEKIKKFFNKLLGKEKQLLLEESKEQQYEEKDISKYNTELYQIIKNGNISLDNLMLEDLIKVLMMSQEELDIDEKKINNLEKEIYNLNTEKIILSSKK